MKKLIIILLSVWVAVSCQSNKKKSSDNSKNITLSGAGATFPLPFYNQVISEYSAKTGIRVSYGGIGSGGGVKSLKDKVVDFGASDAFLSEQEEKDLASPIVHIPTCLGAVVIAFNLPGIESIKLSKEVLTKIFMGEIKKWNDREIQDQNPDLRFPDLNISVIYRSDGSGTTYIFSDYMSKISEKWANEIGRGKALKWPFGLGAKGNPGVSGTIKQTEGAIGYIGSEFAFAQKIPFVKLQNKSGNYIEPGVESVIAAAHGEIPSDTKIMLTDSSDPDAYPICGFTWIILYKEQSYNDRSRKQAEETLKFLQWLIGPDGQNIAPKVAYAPLPKKAAEIADNILKSVTYDGKPVLK